MKNLKKKIRDETSNIISLSIVAIFFGAVAKATISCASTTGSMMTGIIIFGGAAVILAFLVIRSFFVRKSLKKELKQQVSKPTHYDYSKENRNG